MFRHHFTHIWVMCELCAHFHTSNECSRHQFAQRQSKLHKPVFAAPGTAGHPHNVTWCELVIPNQFNQYSAQQPIGQSRNRVKWDQQEGELKSRTLENQHQNKLTSTNLTERKLQMRKEFDCFLQDESYSFSRELSFRTDKGCTETSEGASQWNTVKRLHKSPT